MARTLDSALFTGFHGIDCSEMFENQNEVGEAMVSLPSHIIDGENPNHESWRWWRDSWNGLYSTYAEDWTKKQSVDHKKWLSHINMYICYWDCVADLGPDVSALLQAVTYKYCGRDRESRCEAGASPTSDSHWNTAGGIKTSVAPAGW